MRVQYTARDNDPVIVCAAIVSTSDCLSVSVNQIEQLIEYAIPGHVATVHGNNAFYSFLLSWVRQTEINTWTTQQLTSVTIKFVVFVVLAILPR